MELGKAPLMICFSALDGMRLRRRNANRAVRAPCGPGRIVGLSNFSHIPHDELSTSYNTSNSLKPAHRLGCGHWPGGYLSLKMSPEEGQNASNEEFILKPPEK